jgi:hypothetical protein
MPVALKKCRIGIDVHGDHVDPEPLGVRQHALMEVLTDRAAIPCHERDVGTASHVPTARVRPMRPATSIVLVVLLALIMGAFVINIFMRGLV